MTAQGIVLCLGSTNSKVLTDGSSGLLCNRGALDPILIVVSLH